MAKEKSINLVLGLLLIGSSFALFSCGDDYPSSTANPYYRQGLTLRQQNEIEEAIEAFQKCLRVSPEVAEAHFQIGDLYENHLNKPLPALFHYSQSLEKGMEQEDNERLARQSISRLQGELVGDWAEEYPEIIKAHAGTRELERRNRALTQQNQELEQQLANLRRARETLLQQTRSLIAELRNKQQQIDELQE